MFGQNISNNFDKNGNFDVVGMASDTLVDVTLNSRGGVRGASVAGAVYGFVLIFFSGMFAHFVNLSQYGIKGIGHDCTDAVTVSFLLQNPILGIGILVAFYIVLCLFKKRTTPPESH